jgi:glucose-6-phosphate isomerase
LELENPVIYEYWESDNQFSEGDLSFGYTKIYPGTIGDEFYMTKGHFHVDNSPEIYYTLSGKGKLILMNREGVVEARDMVPGMLSYIPAQWAHRTANTGSEPFIFIGVWPGNIVHDYETTLKDGFASILKTKDGISLEIQNINSKSL